MRFRPFREGDAFPTFQNLVDKVTGEIGSLQNDYVLKASPTELEAYFVGKVTVRPLILHPDDRHIEDKESTMVDVSRDFRRAIFPGERATVPGTRIRLAIPYEGDQGLWKVRPSTFSSSGYPEIDVLDDRIVLSFAFPDDSPEADSLKADIDRQVKSLADAVDNLRHDVDGHNDTARNSVIAALKRKREQAKAASDAVADLGIPVRRRDEPLTYTLPTKRRTVPSEPPRVAKEPYAPEPVLDDAEYQHILKVLRSMSLVIERNPESFASLDEEMIRNHFLLQLNGHYEGSATGETFNASGKTDILIRVKDEWRELKPRMAVPS